MPKRQCDMLRMFFAICVVVGSAATTFSADVIPSARERFAKSDAKEVPDFQRHVVPLLGRLGCNGRACHGSFKGRGGFRLSLFGYDFKKDHAALRGSGDTGEPRVNSRVSEKSLLLRKPTQSVAHEGGRRFKKGGWEHHLLLRWIEGGARTVETSRQLERLELRPASFVAPQSGQSKQLRAIAHWSDGQREDVTDLCRFQSNDDAIVRVESAGLMTTTGRGDTHIVAFYDRGVATLPVIVPVSRRVGANYPLVKTPTRIDELVVSKLRKLGIVPSSLCTDAEFLRRISLDLTGTLPTPGEVERFLVDTSPKKRSKKIDELLKRPAYAAWWTNKLCDFTGCNPARQSDDGQAVSTLWYRWLFDRVSRNVPYDDIVEGIVVAEGRRPGQGIRQYAAEMSAYFRERNPADFAARNTMPFYWSRRSVQKPQDKALSFAHSFLGIRLQCAQCHKHPFDRWTQQDFQTFTSWFGGIRYGVEPKSMPEYRQIAKAVGARIRGNKGARIGRDLLSRARAGDVLPWRELYVVPTSTPGTILGDAESNRNPADPRARLMRWLRKKDNPYFARAFVNRVWANYFGHGIVEPTDNFNPANPPSNAPLLDYLAHGFVKHGFDMKWLHREITGSETYQRSWRPNATNATDRNNFSRALPRRLPAEIVYDAVKQATAATSRQSAVREDLDRRAIGHLSMRMAGTYAMNIFGKPARAGNCDCERVNRPSLLQSIYMQNDPIVARHLQQSGWLNDVRKAGKPYKVELLVRQAFLRTLSRQPTSKELARSVKHIENTESVVEGLRDLLWALLNTKEFILIH